MVEVHERDTQYYRTSGHLYEETLGPDLLGEGSGARAKRGHTLPVQVAIDEIGTDGWRRISIVG